MRPAIETSQMKEEIGARLSEETNRNVNALAVMTALFLPPTLVTGIFGMNTSGLPLTGAHHGSLWAMGLAIAAGLGLGGNESYPDLFQPYGGFPDGVKVENSYVTLPELPGIGFEGKSDLIKEMRALAS